MSWRLRVVHTTGFAYNAPVTSSYNEARLTPRSDHRQNVILNRVETAPATRWYRYTDYWGTAVTAFDLHAPHTTLEVSGSSVVETDPFAAPTETVTWAQLEGAYLRDRFGELLSDTAYVPGSRKLAAVARDLRKGCGPAEAVVAASNWVHEEMSYVPGTTGVHTSALQAWDERAGVCQDYAHLTLLLLRSMGIPSRYVSGYLHPKRSAALGDTVEGESHAWVEAWTGEWWGHDPTNAVEVNEQHVSVAVGRDYADVPPLKGIYSGGGSTDLDVVVEITRLA
ncbi:MULTISPECIES: transglutaminase family protein [Rhodococcus]|uniref:transglutaminase family protein n=1 Tax=Rhodococcus TaxID=1827 RepID=UPI001AE7BD48|nr:MULTISPECIES: transglutaminase family protein [Rhodococcus]MBP1159452.1 transglutaminase-like putative cysteine protease [Rhodococcus sp. PvR099]MCZ4556708.1 transglutaminase family protein [Rhodococcus maanshanensis]